MKLRTRLLIAFFTIVLVPALLFYMSVMMLTTYQAKAIEKTYGINSGQNLFTGASIQIFDSLTQKSQEELLNTIYLSLIHISPDGMRILPGQRKYKEDPFGAGTA